eukprot:scaffold1202_cov384-Prasinococcus_capsulatus_cf.AAC.15
MSDCVTGRHVASTVRMAHFEEGQVLTFAGSAPFPDEASRRRPRWAAAPLAVAGSSQTPER